MSEGERLRLFLDSNVLTGGLVSAWGLDKAVLSLCAARICRLVLAEAVREEVEDNLLRLLDGLPTGDGSSVLKDYGRLMALCRPEVIAYPDEAAVKAARHLIRHAADVPVLLSAIASSRGFGNCRNCWYRKRFFIGRFSVTNFFRRNIPANSMSF